MICPHCNRQMIETKHMPTLEEVHYSQCDQIGQFIGFWATFQSLWQQLICTKSTTFLGNFCEGVKTFNFSSEIILANFCRHLATFYWSH